MAEIKIEIGLDGKVAVAVNGVKGQSCMELTKNIEKALGKAVSSTPTEEMYQNEESSNSNRA